MKTLLLIGLFVITLITHAQTKIEKSIPIKPGQQLVLNFDYPTVKIQTWDKADVLITGTVTINKGEHDDAFLLEVGGAGNEITVTSTLKDKENIPHRIVIKKDDREYYFKTKDYNDPEIQKFLKENGDYSYMSNGISQEINLTVFVPKNISTKMIVKYGLVEVSVFDGPLTIESKYGGVDATILPQSTGQLTARTQYGEILTNLDTKFNQTHAEGKNSKRWTEISASLGKGPAFTLESKYGNVYLRKSK